MEIFLGVILFVQVVIFIQIMRTKKQVMQYLKQISEKEDTVCSKNLCQETKETHIPIEKNIEKQKEENAVELLNEVLSEVF